ncbi:MAG: hypothetical protein HYY06_28565 [Deltaproteobacteria bacterium]|nr:hypothetical protein [Deltaproteobacteria bacterium]
MSRRLLLALALAHGACAKPPPPARPAVAAELDVPMMILEVAAERSFFLQRPGEGTAELEAASREARGVGRTEPLRKLAVALLWDAEGTPDGRSRSRALAAATRAAHEAGGRAGDPRVQAEMAFVELFAAWRLGRPVEQRAARFVRTQRASAETVLYAWLIRGEASLAAERFDQAATAYRWVIGALEHPLYALALYRTAHSYFGLGRNSDARQALREVAALRGTHAAVRRVEAAARADLAAP